MTAQNNIAANGSGPVKGRAEVRVGDAYDLCSQLSPRSVDLILTSPPYWGLRDYEGDHNWDILEQWMAEGGAPEEPPAYEWYRSHHGLLGLEPLPEWYVSNLVAILERAKGALKLGGSLWLNLGDTYFARWSSIRPNGRQGLGSDERLRRRTPMGGYRQEKQLLLIPARVAMALQERRWILRNDLIWYKPNVPPRPERDRLALTHEHFFHFVQRRTQGRPKYYYEMTSITAPAHDVVTQNVRAGRSGHTATFPEALIAPRILSSSPKDGVVLDPFCGIGTTLRVAAKNQRRALGFESNPRYAEAARKGLREIPMLLFT